MTAKTFDLPTIFDIGPVTRRAVREAVAACVQYWPNAHLGEVSPREDLASAFRIMRRRVGSGQSLYQAATYLSDDAMRHVDM